MPLLLGLGLTVLPCVGPTDFLSARSGTAVQEPVVQEPVVQEPVVQEPAVPPTTAPTWTFISPHQTYRLEIPERWRRLTPDEAFLVRKTLPVDIADQIPNAAGFLRFGPVAEWLDGRVDGRCLSISEQDGEPAMDEASLARIRTSVQARSQTGPLRHRIRTLRTTEIGAAAHPVIECVLEVRDTRDAPLARQLVFFAPTGGKMLKLDFRAAADDYDAAEPHFRSIAASVEFAAPPRGPRQLSDVLQNSLIIGGLVGLVLLGLYKLNRS
jgi:hypothetical protein